MNAVKSATSLRIFLSYGHDEHVVVAERLKQKLTERGHRVWIDRRHLRPGVDWESSIEEGLEWTAKDLKTGRMVLLMTPHSVRRPDGYCLNELSRAILRRVTIVPVMVVWCEPPLSICRLQWLDLRDCIPLDEHSERFENRFDRLLDALETGKLNVEGVQSRLLSQLQPLAFEVDIQRHLTRFQGRKWVFRRLDEWITTARGSRVFWITGFPGVGKTALAAWLCTHRREVGAIHLCGHGDERKADPRRCVLSIAYQLSTQLPDYPSRLNSLPLEELAGSAGARTLFLQLIVEPLAGGFPAPDRTLLVVIDGLDEATHGGRNELAELLGVEWERTPPWLRLVITSRPDPEVTYPLQGLDPYVLDASAPENLDDIRSFLRHELVPLVPEEQMTDAVIEHIVDRSEGVFLYVEWTRRELEQGRLALNRLDEFPCGLGGIYAQFFDRQFPDLEQYATRVRPALELLVAAREPLLGEALAALLGWDEYAMDGLLRSVGSLFPSAANGGLRPFHASVRDWLCDRDQAGRYWVSPRAGHRRLAEHGMQRADRGEALTLYDLKYLPDHLRKAGRWEDLIRLLTSLPFPRAKCEARMIYGLVHDYQKSLTGLQTRPSDNGQELSAWARFIDRESHHLSLDPMAFFQQAINQPPDSPMARAAVSASGKAPTQVYFRRLNPPSDLPEPALLRTMIAGGGGVTVTQDGRHVISAAWKELKVWDLTSGELLRSVIGSTDRVQGIAAVPDDRIISWTYDRCLNVWDLKTGRCLRTLDGIEKDILTVVATPKGLRVVSKVSKPARAEIPFRDDFPPLHHGPWSPLRHLGFSAALDTNSHAAVDETPEILEIWDLESRQDLWTSAVHDDVILGVSALANGSGVFSWDFHGTIKIWDLETGEILKAAKVDWHPTWDRAVAVTADLRHAVVASEGKLSVWGLEDGRSIRVIESPGSWFGSVAVTPDGRYAVAGDSDGKLKVFDLEINGSPGATEEPRGGIYRVAVTPEGRWAVSCSRVASSSAVLQVWNLESGQRLRTLHGIREEMEAVVMTARGLRGVEQSGAGSLTIWNLESGRRLRTLDAHQRYIQAIAVTGDGRRVLSASHDNTVKVWSLKNGALLHTLQHADSVHTVTVTPDGPWAASGSLDSTLKVWDLTSGTCIQTLEHGARVDKVWLSPDCRQALSWGADNVVRAWDVESGRCLRSLEIDGGYARALGLDPGKRWIFVRCENEILEVWDIEDGLRLAVYWAPDDLRSAAVSATGVILAGDQQGQLHLLRLERG